jgi:hypothetical protein
MDPTDGGSGKNGLRQVNQAASDLGGGAVNDVIVRCQRALPSAQAQEIHEISQRYGLRLLAALDHPFLTPELAGQIRDQVMQAFRSSKISKDELSTLITRMRDAARVESFQETLAELRNANRLIQSGEAASNVLLGAVKGQRYHLSEGTLVQIDPVDEVDAVYRGADGKLHLEEVKNTPRALAAKLDPPNQLQKLADWRDLDPENRVVEVVVSSGERWTNLFGGNPDGFEKLIDANVPLRIGDQRFSVDQLQELHDRVKERLNQALPKPLDQMSRSERQAFFDQFYQSLGPIEKVRE